MLDLSKERVLVTGAHGFLGRHVVKRLKSLGCNISPLNAPYHVDGYDLRNENDCDGMLYLNRSTVCIHLAATCGGIGANQDNPAGMIDDNLQMGMNVIRLCAQRNVKLVLLGSVCSYPKHCPVPFKESDLFNGYPEETNAPYGIAKRTLFAMADAYHRQHGLKVACLLPANLYGPGDHFEESRSHVTPALVKRFVEAKEASDGPLFNEHKEITRPPGTNSVKLWGTGKATRDFLYVEDAADAIVRAAERIDTPEPLNIGTGKECSIQGLAEVVAGVVGYSGGIEWDHSKPSGQPRRCLDTSRAKQLLDWEASTGLVEGLRRTVEWYLANRKEPANA